MIEVTVTYKIDILKLTTWGCLMHSEWTTTISIGVLSTVSSPRGKSASVKQLSLSPPSPSGSYCSVCFPSCGFSSSGQLTWMLFQLCDFLHQTSLTGNFWGSPCCNIISCYCSVARLCLTLCDPMDCSMPGFLVYHQLPELAQIRVHWVGDAIQPSHPLSPPSPPAFSLSRDQGLFQWVGSFHQVTKVLEFQHQFLQWIFRVDFL